MRADQHIGAAAKSTSLSLTLWAYALIVIFCGCLITGVVAFFGLSASWCLLSRVSRCFSVQRDTLDVALLGLKVWSIPATLMAMLVAAIGQIRGVVVWWNVLIAAALSMLASSVAVPGLAEFAAFPVLLVSSLLLFVGVQLSRLISNRFGGYPI